MNKLEKALFLCKNGKFIALLYLLCKKVWLRRLLPTSPLSLMIEPTNFCNLGCPACPTGSGKMNRPKRTMSFGDFKNIVNQIKSHVAHIKFWNYGEPFLNKDLLKMINCAVSAGIYTSTSTNGEFFQTKQFCLEVVQSGLQHLIICLDGANQRTLSKYRKGSNFKKIVKGFKLINEAKTQLDSETPKIELQFILMKHNEHQRKQVVQLAEKLGFNVYCEKTVGIDYNDPEFQRLAKQLLPKNLSHSRYRLRKDGKFELKGKIPNRCSWVYQTAVINCDGSVVPCCYDLYSEHVMGNVFQQGLKTIWKNDKYQAFRKQIKKDRRGIPICKSCSEGRSRITLD